MDDSRTQTNRRALVASAASLVGGVAGCLNRWSAGQGKATSTARNRTGDGRHSRGATGTVSNAEQFSGGERGSSAQNNSNEHRRSPADALGVAHAGGTYDFTDSGYLNEGATVVEDVGANVLKMWLQSMPSKYPFDTEWSGSEDPVDLARTPQVRRVFDRGFDTYVLVTASAVGTHNFYFRDGFTREQYEREVDTFERLTRHLLEEYDGTGTEFVLQHWEGDWGILGSYDPSETATSRQFDAMRRWLNARQKGIRRARKTVESDVTVLGATEVNLVMDAMSGTPRVTTEVLPETTCDLASLSAWQLLASVAERTDPREISDKVRQVLDFVATHTPEPDEYAKARLGGAPNVYVGEIGYPLNGNGPTRAMRLLRTGTEAALDHGARYVLYWQVFDNETRGEVSGRPTNKDVPGNHLVRPDGTKAPSYRYLLRRVATRRPPTDEWTPLVFRFDRTVPEHSVNPEVKPARGRQLTAAVTKLVFESESEQTIYDIGQPGAEPIVGSGVSAPEESGETTWRWLANPDGEHTFYLRTDRIADVQRLRIVGSPARDGLDLAVSFKDSTNEHTMRADGWLGSELTVPLVENAA